MRGSQPGGALVADWMAARGITHFFTVPGESFLPVLEGLHDSAVTTVTTRHESGASFAAEAFGKLTGRPAICMATRAPGACNLSIGVYTAFYDGTPMLALVGLIPTSHADARSFQGFDPHALFGSIAKRVLVVGSGRSLESTLDQALETATRGRPGPVVVGLPTDILYDEAPPMRAGQEPQPVVPSTSDGAGIDEMVRLMAAATRPAIVMATSADRSRAASAIAQFAEATGIPVYNAWRRYSAFDNDHVCFVGSLGLGAVPSITDSLRQRDVIVSFGYGVEQIAAGLGGLDRDDLHIVQVVPAADPDAARHVHPAQLTQLEVAPDSVAVALASWAAENQGWARELKGRCSEETATLHQRVAKAAKVAPGAETVDRLMTVLDKRLPGDAVVTSDAGNFAHWLLRRLRFGSDRAFLGPASGAMGYGLPAAVGAATAQPERPVLAVAGDGGFLMTIGEMETASRYDLQLAAVVINNAAYGTIRGKQAAESRALFATDLTQVDFQAFAAGCGWQARSVDSECDLEAAVDWLVSSTGRRLLELRTTPGADLDPEGLSR